MLSDVASLVQETAFGLQGLEDRLLGLIRDGARGAKSLEEVLTGIRQVIGEIRPWFGRLLEAQQRRDIAYASVGQLEALNRQSLWLYRKCRIEQIFFAKLRLERTLRDRLYNQVVEIWHEMETLDELERQVQGKSEHALAEELISGVGEHGPSGDDR